MPTAFTPLPTAFGLAASNPSYSPTVGSASRALPQRAPTGCAGAPLGRNTRASDQWQLGQEVSESTGPSLCVFAVPRVTGSSPTDGGLVQPIRASAGSRYPGVTRDREHGRQAIDLTRVFCSGPVINYHETARTHEWRRQPRCVRRAEHPLRFLRSVSIPLLGAEPSPTSGSHHEGFALSGAWAARVPSSASICMRRVRRSSSPKIRATLRKCPGTIQITSHDSGW